MKKVMLVLGTFVAILVLAACGQQTSTRGTTATLYIHGYGGSANSTNFLIKHADHAVGARKVTTATVSPNGQVSLKGSWRKGAKRPIVQVIFQDNHQRNPAVSGKWLRNVVVALQKHDGMTRFNTVAHSMGNWAVMSYALRYANKPGQPRFLKMVSLAGNYDGVLGRDDKANRNQLRGSGAPVRQTAEYKQLVKARGDFPKDIAVWNGYGDLNDGSNSDGRVSMVSALSLGYVVRARAKSYETHAFIGKNAQHSKLHENAAVAKAIEQFLW
ncbi:alpha/beta hydrolase [Lacticaseibacillus pabuli]|uniref:Alpha/beta hydrolase n=1 Tax=Lacticaseibacillus pabuli TaxID=3025672 RepID=A0ABY7WND3_9LACO|nr:alpha/beta hydrolase [Lacticaseibacillus sp. KACC 23028]WDF81717.1 alpha/beta hydrolase [Lacticaseibacillus sp. KACC 23028]